MTPDTLDPRALEAAHKKAVNVWYDLDGTPEKAVQAAITAYLAALPAASPWRPTDPNLLAGLRVIFDSEAALTPIQRICIRKAYDLLAAAPPGSSETGAEATATVPEPATGWTGNKCPDCRGCGMRVHPAEDNERACSACAGTGDEYRAAPQPPAAAPATVPEAAPELQSGEFSRDWLMKALEYGHSPAPDRDLARRLAEHLEYCALYPVLSEHAPSWHEAALSLLDEARAAGLLGDGR